MPSRPAIRATRLLGESPRLPQLKKNLRLTVSAFCRVYVPPNPEPTFYRAGNGTKSAFVPTGTGGVTGSSPTATSAMSKDVCASVSVASASYAAAHPSATPRVPAKLAYDCLNAIPFNQTAAEQLILALEPYTHWQTTIEYIKSPPAEYAAKVQAPYDFYASFDSIKSKVFSGSYKSEYEFGYAVYRAFQQTHDGHFVFIPDVIGGVFNFGRATPLVSVSKDGHSIPEIYAYSDVLAASYSKTAASRISPVTQIDGQDAITYLLNWSQYGSLQDKDALWNNLFYSPPQVALGSSGSGVGTFAGAGRGRWVYPDEYTTITFANGTMVKNENFATVLSSFAGINNGGDIYSTYFAQPEDSYYNIFNFNPYNTSQSAAPPTPTTAAASSAAQQPAAAAAVATTPRPGYPSPVVANPDNQNSGYFLEGAAYNDVAVLAVNSFVGSGSETDFQNVNSELIAQAVKQNKTKLIIDVSANGGGTILQGYDLFKQLFPSMDPYGANRFRALEALDLLGKQDSYISEMYPRTTDLDPVLLDLESSAFNYETDMTADAKPFKSWPEKFGPIKAGPAGDEFTNLFRWNLTDPLITYNSGGIEISGYGARSNVTKQPFKAENIIIIYDGYCASTCTIFSEFMRQQAGIKTISLGGRPNLDITQAVGGVKGTNDLSYDYIIGIAAEILSVSNDSLAKSWENSVIANYTYLPISRSINDVFNARDGIRKGDKTNTPLQFVYEPAECRVLYTPEMVIDETAVWKTVADTVWNGKSACVAGSNHFYGNATTNAARSEGLPARHEVRRDFDYQSAWRSLDMRTSWSVENQGDGYMPL